MEPRSRSSVAAAALLVVLAASVSAHRRDEYLQAARVALQPDGVTIHLDLTPGIEVAGAILGAIDRDRDGALSADEQRVYADQVVRAIDVRVDGDRLPLRLNAAVFPDPPSMRGGEGTIRLQLSASHRPLNGGAHQLLLRNLHRPGPSVYLANALVPESARLSVIEQRRDPRQTELTIDYTVRADAAVANAGWLLAGLPIAAVLLFRFSRRRIGRQAGTVQ